MVRSPRQSVWLSAVSLAALACIGQQALAAENGLQRYSPGVGGSDMTAPLTPGMYLQVPLVHYHARKLRGGDHGQATSATPITSPLAVPGLRSEIGVKADTYAALPRFTYLSTTRVLGANLGFTVMLPVVKREADFTASPVFAGTPLAAASAGQQAAVAAGINSRLASTSDGKETGLGDLEFSPIFHWEIGDNQAVNFAPTIVLPTGKYDVKRRVNPGYGNFYTFRPSLQYSYIGDGWDFGARTVLSFNTRNKDNGYYSGTMFNVDWQLMRFISDDVRVGLQGYFVRQLTRDTQDLSKFSQQEITDKNLQKEIIGGNRSSATAVGPAVGWVVNGGEALVEGKFLQEFGARNRTEGSAFWLSVSKPL
jgi:hypothetical protein